MMKAILLGLVASVALAPAAMAERATDGNVNIIYWQAPSIMNPYLSGGVKDRDASSIVLEPMGSYDLTGNKVPTLAAEIPTLENGGVSQDLKSITWKLKPGLLWSDGTPVTAADVVFTAKYCMHPEGGCAQLAAFEGVESLEAQDHLTVKINFKEPQPNPYGPFMGARSPILQNEQFADCVGGNAPACTAANFNPIGTGAFKVDTFKPNDVITFSANSNYRDPQKPAFATVTLKGGGDAAAAARAVLQTGEYDLAWNLQLSPEVLSDMEQNGNGEVVVAFGSQVERIEMNSTDPSSSLPPDERATREHPHPILSDSKVREALSIAIDRVLLTEIGYGKAGKPTCNLIANPQMYASDNTKCLTQDIDGANALLDEAGWIKGSDGVRVKDGKRLSLLFQTSTNAVRQDFQALIKQWWQEIGVETELRNISASVFFGGDPGSPDTYQRFYADVEMYGNQFEGTDPQSYLAERVCAKIPTLKSQWQGQNINRFCNPEYDKLVAQYNVTGNEEERRQLAMTLNDMLTKDSNSILPLVLRGQASAMANTLGGYVSNPWDSELGLIADWYRKTK